MTNTNYQIPDVMTVAEAALALSVSRSTVYRYPRADGPFTIIKQGRRVFIDRSSFNRYVSARFVGTVDAVSEEPRGTEESEPVGNREGETPTPTEPPASPSHREHTGCGQRELVMPVRWPMVAIYVY